MSTGSNQVFANRTSKYLEGRTINGDFGAHAVTVTAPLPIGTVTTNQIPFTVGATELTANIDMVVFAQFYASIAADATTWREVIIEQNGVPIAKTRVSPAPLVETSISVSTILIIEAGQTLDFRAGSGTVLALNVADSFWRVVRLF